MIHVHNFHISIHIFPYLERSDSIDGAERLYLMERQRLKEGGLGGRKPPQDLRGVRGGVTLPRVPYFQYFRPYFSICPDNFLV